MAVPKFAGSRILCGMPSNHLAHTVSPRQFIANCDGAPWSRYPNFMPARFPDGARWCHLAMPRPAECHSRAQRTLPIKYWNGIWGTNPRRHFPAIVRVSDQSIQWDKALAVHICSGHITAWMFRVSCLSSAPSSDDPSDQADIGVGRIPHSIHDAFQLLAQQSFARGATYRYSRRHRTLASRCPYWSFIAT